MKAFHNLEEAIRLVFEHRDTPLSLPITYTNEEMKQVQNFWNEYLKNLRTESTENLSTNIAQVIDIINDWRA